jgi:transcriptional regulator of acetoin/glycerol metabolism
VILCEADAITIANLPEHIVDGSDAIFVGSSDHRPGSSAVEAPTAFRGSAPKAPAHPTTSPLLLDEVSKNTLLRSLEETDGKRRRAVDLLGVSRSTLYRMLARYGMDNSASEDADSD